MGLPEDHGSSVLLDQTGGEGDVDECGAVVRDVDWTERGPVATVGGKIISIFELTVHICCKVLYTDREFFKTSTTNTVIRITTPSFFVHSLTLPPPPLSLPLPT